jgi:exodeoxyribonuclease VII large subunit
MPSLLPWPDQVHVFSVSDLAVLIKETLEAGLGTVWVAGEVSNLRIPSSGHCYFTLKDERSQVSSVMFRPYISALPFRPEEGMEVIVQGRVSFYAARGGLQLYVERMEPKGVGALQLALEQLKKKLAAEGLFSPERKRVLPFLPQHIGVVTALTGAAIRDILTILFRRFPNLHVVIRPTKVQGTGAAQEIAAGIHDLNTHGQAEVIIVGRGGGSREDLGAFNEEVVARAIFSSAVPVVSAVGHEIDLTIADLVADRRAPTPTAAAEMAVPQKTDLGQQVEGYERALYGTMRSYLVEVRTRTVGLGRRLRDPRRRVGELRLRLSELWLRTTRQVHSSMLAAVRENEIWSERLFLQSPALRARVLRRQVAAAAAQLEAAFRRLEDRAQGRVQELAARLDSLSPLAVLNRGYSIARKLPEEKIVTDATVLTPGDRLRLRFARGEATVQVITRISAGKDDGKIREEI